MYCIVVFCIDHASNKKGFKTMIKNVWQWDAKERPQNQELNIIWRLNIKWQKGEKNHLTYSTCTKDMGYYMLAWVHMQDIIYVAKVTIISVPTSAYIYVSTNIMR